MALQPTASEPAPAATAHVARAAFPGGHVSLIRRDARGTSFPDADGGELSPARGQPGRPPGRLALVTGWQLREELSDRHAAEAVRARLDWRY
jgi:transposase